MQQPKLSDYKVTFKEHTQRGGGSFITVQINLFGIHYRIATRGDMSDRRGYYYLHTGGSDYHFMGGIENTKKIVRKCIENDIAARTSIAGQEVIGVKDIPITL